jgi:hypothetical protein
MRKLWLSRTRHLESRKLPFVWTRHQIPLTASYLGLFKGLDNGEILESKHQFSSSKPPQHFNTNNNYAPNIIKAAKDGKPKLAKSLFLRLLQEYTENKTGEKPSPKLLGIILNA